MKDPPIERRHIIDLDNLIRGRNRAWLLMAHHADFNYNMARYVDARVYRVKYQKLYIRKLVLVLFEK